METTTFVLHGGQTSTVSEDNGWFFRCFTDFVDKQHVKVLLCYWARAEDEWAALLDRDSSKVLAQTKKQVEFEIANDPKDLFDKLPKHDVLYVAGGDAGPIEKHLPKLNGLGESLRGKVYLGSSMGVFIVSKHYVLSFDSQDNKSVHHGLGILPIMTLCHWNVETRKQDKIQLLKTEDMNLPILTLCEEKSAVFSV